MDLLAWCFYNRRGARVWETADKRCRMTSRLNTHTHIYTYSGTESTLVFVFWPSVSWPKNTVRLWQQSLHTCWNQEEKSSHYLFPSFCKPGHTCFVFFLSYLIITVRTVWVTARLSPPAAASTLTFWPLLQHNNGGTVVEWTQSHFKWQWLNQPQSHGPSVAQ